MSWNILMSSIYIYMYFACMSVCLFVSKNVKTAEPIGPNFFVVPHMTKGRYRWSKFQKFASNKTRFSLNFKNPRMLFYKIREFFFFLFYNLYIEKMITIEIEDSLVKYILFACLSICQTVSADRAHILEATHLTTRKRNRP